MPTYTIFAGVNGCGKTSIYKSVYYESLENLNQIIEICDEVNIYDNTDRFKEIVYFKDGNLTWNDNILPKWSNKLVK